MENNKILSASQIKEIVESHYSSNNNYTNFYSKDAENNLTISLENVSCDENIECKIKFSSQKIILVFKNCSLSFIYIDSKNNNLELNIENSNLDHLFLEGTYSSISLMGSDTTIFTLGKIEIWNLESYNILLSQFLNLNYIEINNSCIDDFEINNCFLSEKMDIQSFTCEEFKLIKVNKEINGEINLQNTIKINNISILESKIKSIEFEDFNNINISSKTKLNAQKLVLSKNRINLFKINANSQINFLKVKSNVFESFIFTGHSKVGQFYLGENEISESILISGEKNIQFYVNEIYLNNKLLQLGLIENIYLNRLLYLEFNKSTLHLKNVTCTNLVFKNFSTNSGNYLNFNDCFFSNIEFSNFNNLGYLCFNNTKPIKHNFIIKEFEFYDNKKEEEFYKFEELNIIVIEFQTKILILNSDIGKTSFINTDLEDFDKLVYSNSKISEIFLGEIKFPNKFEIINFNEKRDKRIQERLLYGQLKKLYENSGNRIEALEYGAREMEIYQEQINKGDIKPIKGERIQILFNWHTNRHTTSWRQGLWLTFFVSAYLYLCYCLLINDYGCNMTKVFKYIPYYFNFINPVHKVDFLVPESNFKVEVLNWNYGIALTIDFISRLIIPILAYQMIQAFRKYGK